MIPMTALKRFFLAVLFASACLPLRAEQRHLVSDFDGTAPEPFSFKDDKGSTLTASTAYTDKEKGRHLGARYEVVPGGWAGWGLGMNGFDASGYRYLAFDLRGEKGGETFEIGLRDEGGQEKKIPIGRFLDVTTSWQQVLVPLTAFKGLNLASLNNINLGFSNEHGKGRVFMDNFRFEGIAGVDAESLRVAPTLVNKALIDGFERTNPDSVYQVFRGDLSNLALTSSRILFDGDYAMEMEYEFSTTNLWGSWVSAIRYFQDPLDWTGAQEVKLWIKGDGSDNAFRFRVGEVDGELWEYVDDQILNSNKYNLLTMPVKKFKLLTPTKTNARLDLDKIRSYQLDVMSPSSSQSAGSKSTKGRIQVDQLYIAGEKIVMSRAAPPGTVPQLRQAVSSIGNVDFTAFALTEYTNNPEEKNRVIQFAKLIANAKLSNLSARLELGTKTQEFGEASTLVGSSVTTTENRFPEMEAPSIQIMAHNVSPHLTNVTLGNLFVDYGPYVFAPVFGFKGLSLEGDYENINYHGFVIKHAANSFAAGNRNRFLWRRVRLASYAVYWEQNARIANPNQVSGGALQPAPGTVMELEPVARDLVYNLEAEIRLASDRITLRGVNGYNRYRQTAEMNIADPFNPIFAGFLPEPREAVGRMWRGRAQFDALPWRGLNATYEYRDVGTAYKPHFRQVPVFFDDAESDQWGHNIRTVQYFKGLIFSNEYDIMHRHSNSDYYRRRNTWAVGLYGYKGLDIAVNQEYRRAKYVFTSDRSSFSTITNERVIASELYIRSQLTPRTAIWVKPRQEHIWHPATNNNFVTDSLQSRLEFYISTNARLFAEHKVTRFSTPEAEPQSSPFDDNYVKVTFEVSF